ncbi:SH3 domain-containing protein [Streptomyces olivochromogenes]|uniref:SH3 domain-containing protein n=1 Tax=Streptomyces olivochromogenes TaxID=1963 RepID=UPI001F2A953C|nr:SH3 domain-containing protein [Streptomyces olivochromogenes]MCF3135490.1 SH3 domain-containing protein [Streptomyces olivochromogenes]
MIRRTLKSGLLATVAVFALLPTAAGAAEAGHTAPLPAPATTAQYGAPSLLPAPARRAPAKHRTTHRVHRVHRTRHCTCPTHRTLRRTTHRRHTPAMGRVTTHRLALNVRSGPGTGHRVVGHRHANRRVALACKTYGSWVRGTGVWYRLTHHRGYVSAHYVRGGAALPWC